MIAAIAAPPCASNPIATAPLRSVIQKIALRCLAELAISLAIAAFISLFSVPIFGILILLESMVLQTAINTALLAGAAFANYRASQDPSHERHWTMGAQCCDRARYLAFAWLTIRNLQMILHEAGHVLGAVTFYKDCGPRIKFLAVGEAVSRFRTVHLTALGEKVGRKMADFFVTAAGPALAIFASSVLLGLSKKWAKSEWICYLRAAAICNIGEHVIYALSALRPSLSLLRSHDFVKLASMGVHPLAAAVAIAAIPYFIYTTVNP